MYPVIQPLVFLAAFFLAGAFFTAVFFTAAFFATVALLGSSAGDDSPFADDFLAVVFPTVVFFGAAESSLDALARVRFTGFSSAVAFFDFRSAACRHCRILEGRSTKNFNGFFGFFRNHFNHDFFGDFFFHRDAHDGRRRFGIFFVDFPKNQEFFLGWSLSGFESFSSCCNRVSDDFLKTVQRNAVKIDELNGASVLKDTGEKRLIVFENGRFCDKQNHSLFGGFKSKKRPLEFIESQTVTHALSDATRRATNHAANAGHSDTSIRRQNL